MQLPDSDEIKLGYRLTKAYWGRGFATEAASAWLAHAFGKLGLARLIAFAHPANGASIRVMQKTGFRFLRQNRLYGMASIVYVAEVHPRLR
jgi:RimJ/RimL family protein N-acetyltransferase